jgi:hypothetical protein
MTLSVAEKAINGILDYVSASPDLDTSLMQKFYEATLKSLGEAKNEVCSLSLARLCSYGCGHTDISICWRSEAEHKDESEARQIVARSQGVHQVAKGTIILPCLPFPTSACVSPALILFISC